MFSLTPNRILSHWPFADQFLTSVYHEVCRSVHFHASHVLVKFPLTMAFTRYFLPLYSLVALRAVALVLLLGFTWLLANSMLGGDGNSLIRMLFSGKDVTCIMLPSRAIGIIVNMSFLIGNWT